MLGLILDGLGYGSDGTFWGGELLYADYRRYRRLAHLKPAPLPGGSKALVEPWRNLVAQLWQAGIPMEACPALRAKPSAALLKILGQGIGSPLASSCGRLFDAVAAAVGVCFDTQSYEGQAAAELERLAWQGGERSGYPLRLIQGDLPWVLEPAPLWPALLSDLAQGVPKEAIAQRFHIGLVDAWCRLICAFSRRLACFTVVLSGGVFQNRLLLEAMTERLAGMGVEVWLPHQVPMNDGGLALGQAAVAAAAN